MQIKANLITLSEWKQKLSLFNKIIVNIVIRDLGDLIQKPKDDIISDHIDASTVRRCTQGGL
jgi:hypothetical protein